jgi:hypothetical protein
MPAPGRHLSKPACPCRRSQRASGVVTAIHGERGESLVGARSGKLTAMPTTSSGSLRLREPGPRQSNNDPSDSGHGDIGREHKYHNNPPAWAPSPGWAPCNDGVVRVCAGSVIDAKHTLTALCYITRYPEWRIAICAKLLTLEAVATEGARMSPIRAESTTSKRFALQLLLRGERFYTDRRRQRPHPPALQRRERCDVRCATLSPL